MNQLFWNTRYANAEYAYGTAPNVFLQEQLKGFPCGKLLFPCDGEGRNGVYAATLKHDSYAFDMSEEGQRKAQQLARQHGVPIHYQVSEFSAAQYPENSFDGIAMIYAHLPESIRAEAHTQLLHWLKPGGTLWLEGFSTAHTAFQAGNPHAGGPKDPSMLYTEEQLRSDFVALNIHHLQSCEIELHEGPYHHGRAAVIRMIGTKK